MSETVSVKLFALFELFDPVLLTFEQGNLDLNLPWDYYKAVSCVTVYFSKSKAKTSEVLKQGVY